jgi:hypothetical protein
VEVREEGSRVIATTAHYRLEAEADAVRARDWARLLEASFAQQSAIFEGVPARLPLTVKVFRDAASFRAGLSADGLGAVGEAGGAITSRAMRRLISSSSPRATTRRCCWCTRPCIRFTT